VNDLLFAGLIMRFELSVNVNVDMSGAMNVDLKATKLLKVQLESMMLVGRRERRRSGPSG